jgi:hypothetical protein
VAFLNREGSRKNFFPVYEEQSFVDGTTRGFDPKDFIVIEREGAIAGVAGLWDQSAYKQSIVDAYDPLTRAARPIYNTAAKVLRRATLPKPGSVLRFGYGSFFCAVNDDPAIARELITRLLAAARTFRHVAYPAGIFTVAWDDGNDFHDSLDARPRSLEIASL